MQGKDPDQVGCFGRLSFKGFNPVVESLQSVAQGEEPPANKAAAAGGSSAQQQEEGADVGQGQMAAALGSSGGRHHHHHHHHQRHQQQDGERWISGKNAFRSGVKKHKR